MSEVLEMYKGNISLDVQEKFDRLREHMSTQGNHICTACGSDMISDSGCFKCLRCGGKDCGA